MTAPTEVGVIGCGNWGRHIVRDLGSLGCRVVVVDPSDASRAVAAASGAAASVASIDQLPPVDGIVVATPTVLHAETIERVLPRGVPIFVEKPLTCDVASARSIVERARDRVFVMHKWRYHPGVEALAEIARSGELGPVEGMRLLHVGWGNPHADVDVVWILAPHCLSIAFGVLGRIPPPLAAIAARDGPGGRATGLVGLLGPGPPWVSLDVSAQHPDKARRYSLYCRDGVAELLDTSADGVRIARGRDPRYDSAPAFEHRPIAATMPLLSELAEFVGHLRGGPPPRTGADEGLAVVEAIAALRALAGIS